MIGREWLNSHPCDLWKCEVLLTSELVVFFLTDVNAFHSTLKVCVFFDITAIVFHSPELDSQSGGCCSYFLTENSLFALIVGVS